MIIDSIMPLSCTIAGGANRAAVVWWLEHAPIPMISIARQTGIPLSRVYSAALKPRDVEAIARVIEAARPAKFEIEWSTELHRLRAALPVIELQARAASSPENESDLSELKRAIVLIEFALLPLPQQWARVDGYGISSDPLALTCKQCASQWLPRKENPRECPRCQSSRWNG